MKPGDVYNRLTATKKLEGMIWEFRCSCGSKHVAYANNVRSGATKSCGCLRNERLQKMAGNNAIVRAELWAEFLDIQEIYQIPVDKVAEICGRKPETVKRWYRKSGSSITVESMELLRGYLRASYN